MLTFHSTHQGPQLSRPSGLVDGVPATKNPHPQDEINHAAHDALEAALERARLEVACG